MEEKLNKLGEEAKTFLFMKGFSIFVLLLIILVFVTFGLDYQFRLDYYQRLIMLCICASALAFVLLHSIFTRLTIPFKKEDLALAVERKFTHLNDSLISSIQLERELNNPQSEFSHELINAVITDTQRAVLTLNFNKSINYKNLRKIILTAIMLSICGIVGSILIPNSSWATWFDRNVLLTNARWPRNTILYVKNFTGNSKKIANGDDFNLTIKADPNLEIPDSVTVFYKTKTGKLEEKELALVGEDKNEYRHKFKNVSEDMEFYVEGGDDKTAKYYLKVLPRPQIENIEYIIIYPKYTKQKVKKFGKKTGLFYLVNDTVMKINIKTTKKIAEALLIPRTGNDIKFNIRMENKKSIYKILKMDESIPPESQFSIYLKDNEGITNQNALKFALFRLEDRLPKIIFKIEGVGSKLTPEANIPMLIDIEDDFGIKYAKIVYKINAPNKKKTIEKELPLKKFKPGKKKIYDPNYTFDIKLLKIPIGSRFTFYLKATDFMKSKKERFAKSTSRSFIIVSADKLLNELLRREQMLRKKFEKLIDKEKKMKWLIFDINETFEKEKRLTNKELKIISDVERTQRYVDREVNNIAQSFRQIKKEMKNNRLADKLTLKRMHDKIISPLQYLSLEFLVKSANRIESIEKTPAIETRGELIANSLKTIEKAIRYMEEILSNMAKSEAFSDIVHKLRKIIRWEEDLRKETKKKHEEIIKKILGGSEDEDKEDNN